MQFKNSFDYMLSLRTRNQHRRGDDQIHSPEFLMTRDVLCWDAARAFREHSLVASLLLRTQFALGMCEQISREGTGLKHSNQLSTYSRIGYLDETGLICSHIPSAN